MDAKHGLEQRVRELTEAAIASRVFPGGVVGYATNRERAVWPFGRFTYEPTAPLVQADTIYDVASITKSIPTSCLAAQALEAGKLNLDDKVITYIPELQNPYRELITIRHLLTYTVVFDQPQGLSGIVKLYGRDFLTHALQSPLKAAPGKAYFYTNQPALLLGLILERLENRSLAELAQTAFFEPLSMTDTSYRPDDTKIPRIPPSEIVDGKEIRGVVHDETARVMASMGHDSGLAGLFSTADDLLTFGSMLFSGGTRDGKSYLSPEMINRMATNQIGYINEHTGLGWEINRPEVMGKAARDRLLIKSGHTGCIIVVDLANQAAIVMLSNRMYPTRGDRTALRQYWLGVNEAFWDYLQAASAPSGPAHH